MTENKIEQNENHPIFSRRARSKRSRIAKVKSQLHGRPDTPFPCSRQDMLSMSVCMTVGWMF